MTSKYDSIQKRMCFIDDILRDSNLQNSNPLNSINNSSETEKFEGNQNKNDNKSLDTRYALGKQTLKFKDVMEKLNAMAIYVKSGTFGSTFKGVVISNNVVKKMFAIKMVAYAKREGYGSINSVTRPENAEICMLKLLSYFVIKRQTPHLLIPFCTFNTNIKTFIECWDNNNIEKFKKDDKGSFFKNEKGEYIEFAPKYFINNDGKYEVKKKNFFKNEPGDLILIKNIHVDKAKRDDFIKNECANEHYIKNNIGELILVNNEKFEKLRSLLANTKERYYKINTKYEEFVNNYKNGYFNDTVSILITEWADRGDLAGFLRRVPPIDNKNLPTFERLNSDQWARILFQIISTLAIIQEKYPDFRHNDFKPNNILVSKVEDSKFITKYQVGDTKYIVPSLGYCIYIWDFDFACIPGVIDNKKLHKKWTNRANIKPVRNRYYDVHYFFCTLVYKGFLPEILSSKRVPQNVKDFINWVIPFDYRPVAINETRVDPERCRMLVDDEVHLPVDILKHDFFSAFRT